MRISDCYKTLNVRTGAEWQEIKKAYRTLAKQYHPDSNLGSAANESQFKQVSLAYQKLERHYHKSSNRPQRYIAVLQTYPPDNTPPAEQEKEPGRDLLQKSLAKWVPSKTRELFNKWANEFKRIFFEYERKFFSLDVQKILSLQPATAAAGSTLKIRTSTDSFQVKIPATDEHQIELRIPEKGAKSFITGKHGDLLLKLRVIPGGQVRPGSTNFFYDMKVPRQDVDEGKVMTLRTIQGAIKFFVPKTTIDGQTFVLKARPDDPTTMKINHICTLYLT